MTTANNMARLRIVESPHLNAHQSVDILHRYFRSWPGAASSDGFQKADIRNPLILPTTTFWRHA
jgi:hypothetical protein